MGSQQKNELRFELGLWNSLEVQFDYFTEKRTNILQIRQDIPTTMGLQAQPQANIGEAKGHGIDLSVDYNKSFTKNFWAIFSGNFTYATSKYLVYEEPDYVQTPWRSRIGQNSHNAGDMLQNGFSSMTKKLRILPSKCSENTEPEISNIKISMEI